MNIKVLPSALKHGVSVKDVVYGWSHLKLCIKRIGKDYPPRYLAIGCLKNGNLIELIGFQDGAGVWVVFHAMCPPTRKFLTEMKENSRRNI